LLAPYVTGQRVGHQGRRLVEGQRPIQGAPDIFLGWCEGEGHHFYVRQLRDMKGGAELEPGAVRSQGFVHYAMPCGWALALAHAQSGDAAMIADYAGKSEALDDALTGFAFAYAEQTEGPRGTGEGRSQQAHPGGQGFLSLRPGPLRRRPSAAA
jgi:hypothetical protein